MNFTKYAVLYENKYVLPMLGVASYLSLFFSLQFVIFCVWLFALAAGGRFFKVVTLLFIPLLFGVYSVQKMPVSDALNYISMLKELSDTRFLALPEFSFLSVRSSEILFVLYSWVLANIDSSGVIFFFTTTFIIYFLLLLALLSLGENDDSTIFTAVLVVFLVVSFSLVGHVVRQYLASSILLYFLCKYKGVKLICGIAILSLIHKSVILFIPLYVLFSYFGCRSRFFFVFLFSILISFLASKYLSNIDFIKLLALTKTDHDIPIVLILVDVLFVAFCMAMIDRFGASQTVKRVAVFAICNVFIVVFFRDISLFSLRYYFYFEVVRLVFVFYLIGLVRKDGIFNVLYFLFISFSLAVFSYRFIYSPWDYGSKFNALVNIGLFDLLDRVIIIW